MSDQTTLNALGGFGRRGTWPVARNVVDRGRVFRRLDGATGFAGFLVSAPAGYGKSLAVASWLSARGYSDSAWANLATVGSDCTALWTTVLDSLILAHADDNEELAKLAALAEIAPDSLPARIAHWMAGLPAPQVIVLDDVHGVTGPVAHEQLVELVACAPANLHVLFLSRHDPPWPLHRMRLDGLLGEVRAEDVAFDRDEAAQMFDLVGHPLSEDQVTDLMTRTQGWAAGLRMAALTVGASPDPAELARTISGSTGYIADYLLREVFAQLPREWRDFLVAIGTVDVVCADLAEALGGGKHSAQLLAELALRNAFIHELGTRPGWYRIHPLLLDFLRSRATDRRRAAELHRLAADWFRAQEDPWSALSHALTAEDWPLAGLLVEENIVTWSLRRPPLRLVLTLQPLPHEVLRSVPGLALGLACATLMSGSTEGVAELLDASAAAGAPPGTVAADRQQVLRRFARIGMSRWAGDLSATRDVCLQIADERPALAVLGLSHWDSLRVLLVSNAGTCELWLGDLESAYEHLSDCVDYEQTTATLPVLNARAHLGYLLWERGDLDAAAKVSLRAVESFASVGLAEAVQATPAYLALAAIALDRDEPAATAQWLDGAERSSREPHTDLVLATLRARLHLAKGQAYAAAKVLRAALAAAGSAPVPPRLVDAAEAVLSGGPTSPPATPGDDRAPTVETRRQTVDRLLRLALIDAPVADRAALLERALAEAARQGLRRPFLDHGEELRPVLLKVLERGTSQPEFAVDLLNRTTAAQTEPGTRHRSVLVPLSERERSVLSYLVTSMATSEIAAALYVSVNTVKTHQRSIYQKLGASSRREAVAHARDLGLL